MTVMQFDPLSQLDRVFRGLLPDGGTRGTRRMPIPMDVYRRGDEYVVELDLPGVSPDQIEVTAERNVISVRADRSATHPEGDEVLVCERPHMVLERQIYASDNLDTDRMQAAYRNGVLTLRLPLSEKSKPRRVNVLGSSEPAEVRAGNGAGAADESARADEGAASGGQSAANQDTSAGTTTSA
jgi:HSP20 family protein